MTAALSMNKIAELITELIAEQMTAALAMRGLVEAADASPRPSPVVRAENSREIRRDPPMLLGLASGALLPLMQVAIRAPFSSDHVVITP